MADGSFYYVYSMVSDLELTQLLPIALKEMELPYLIILKWNFQIFSTKNSFLETKQNIE